MPHLVGRSGSELGMSIFLVKSGYLWRDQRGRSRTPPPSAADPRSPCLEPDSRNLLAGRQADSGVNCRRGRRGPPSAREDGRGWCRQVPAGVGDGWLVGPQWQERIGELERGSSDDDGTGTKGSGCSGRGSLPACSCFNESGARYSRGPRVSRIVFVNCVLGKIGGYERERGYADAWDRIRCTAASSCRACVSSLRSIRASIFNYKSTMSRNSFGWVFFPPFPPIFTLFVFFSVWELSLVELCCFVLLPIGNVWRWLSVPSRLHHKSTCKTNNLHVYQHNEKRMNN